MLLGLVGALTYVVIQPSYNFAHLIPRNFLRNIGINYASILWAEQNADVFLHFSGGFGLTWLLLKSKLPLIKDCEVVILILVSTLCVAAELVQHLIGRGIETSDLLLGICGSFMAYLGINKKN